jgi:eukaryotic-like serine/threonine-protein kinase
MPDHPSTLGRYEVEHPIGSGAFGDVYLATLHGAMEFRKRFAIKVIGRDRPGCDPRKIGAFVREARLGETLHHPNIVAIQEFGQQDDLYFLVMEYIDGVSLQAILGLCVGRGVAVPQDAICELGVQVCAGLDHAHTARDAAGELMALVHRDLKPGNLMVDRTGTVRIVDFGIARASTSPYFTTRTGEVKGTPRYMAPEQVSGMGRVGPATDLYSLGLVLCELATNEPVFTADSIERMLDRVVHNDIADATKKLRRAAPDLYPVVVRALATDPRDRPPSAAAMSEALRDVWWTLGGKPRMSIVARATTSLAPREDSLPAVEAATVEWTAPRHLEEGPASWPRFYEAFGDQLGELPPAEVRQPRPEPPGSMTRVMFRWVGRLGVVVGLLVLALVAVLALPYLRPGSEPAPPPPGPLVEAATPEAATPEPVTVEPPTPVPVTAEPLTAEPLTPEPIAPGPLSPEPVAAEPVTGGQAAGHGLLQVASRPWSNIYLDGEFLGRTGAPSFEVPAGRHTVKLELPGTDRIKVFHVNVGADAAVNVGCWDFEASAPCS